MKNTKIYIMMVVSVVLSLALQGCGSGVSESITLSKSKIETRLASEGELLIDNMIEVYKQVQELTFQSEYDGVIADVSSSSVKDFQARPFINAEYRNKIQLLYLYKQALHEYSVLADEGFAGKPAAFANCTKAVADAFSELKDTAAFREVEPATYLIGSSRYDENAVADYLSNALGVMWYKDIEDWNTVLNENFIKLQENLASVPDDAFNEEKLSSSISAPFSGKQNLVRIYKLNIIKERRAELNDFMRCQDNITASLQYLRQALTEFQKKGFDKDVVINYLNRIQVMLDENHHYLHEAE